MASGGTFSLISAFRREEFRNIGTETKLDVEKKLSISNTIATRPRDDDWQLY